MGFGCPYSLLEVDSIEFVKTSFKKKLIRTFLGALITVVFFSGCNTLYINMNEGHKQDFISQFMATRAGPGFFIALFIYGPFVVIC